MDNTQNAAPMETADELAAEKDHQQVPTEEAVRDAVIKEYGFDPENDVDKERIEKAVKREMGHRTSLSKAIGTKIRYRTDLEAASKKAPPAKPEKGLTSEDVDRRVSETLEQRDLDALEYPDDIKEAIKSVARINNTTVKKALSDSYIKSKIETWEKDQEATGSGVSRTNKSGGKAMTDTDPSIPPDVDMNTKEGRDAYDAWLKKQIEAGH